VVEQLEGDGVMCADGKEAYREQGYKPRKGEELWAASPMNEKNRKKRETKEMEFFEETMR
jgi:hypothetical protein